MDAIKIEEEILDLEEETLLGVGSSRVYLGKDAGTSDNVEIKLHDRSYLFLTGGKISGKGKIQVAHSTFLQIG